MFELTEHPIDSAALRAKLERPEAGACVIFEGWVRNHHLGQPVRELHYEAFDVMAKLEGNSIIAEIEERFPGCAVFCVHRTGALRVGELAVWIGVSSAHRAAAFLACRQAIEEIKRRLPVWKKEFHPDGAAEWVNCTTEAIARGPQPTDYYSRQASLPEVGDAGQKRLAAAHVLIVGVGGLGCPAALYLAGSGVGQITLVDSGKVELSNLPRQILFTTDDLGLNKADAAVTALRARNPFVKIEALAAEFTAQNARSLVAGKTVVLDCSDNFATRFVMHDACFSAGIPLVQAAVHRFEGTLDVFQRGKGGCLHCLRQNRSISDLDAAAGNCAGGAVFGPAVGILGTLQASEALRIILGRETRETFRQTHLINLLDCSILPITRDQDPKCPVCRASNQDFSANNNVVPPKDAAVVINAESVAALGPHRLIALLEKNETLDPAVAATGTQAVAIGDVAQLRELASESLIVLTCRHGIRSAALARLLRAEGCTTIYALEGGSSAVISNRP